MDGSITACPECGASSSAGKSGPGGEFESAFREFEEALAAGHAPDVDEFCARFPDIRERLARALGLSKRLQDISRGSTTGSPPAPERLGPYRLMGELGRGGMAPVYLARDERLGREVALKLIDRTTLHGPSRVERFLREARALARIDHPNVVPIHDIGEDAGYCYIAMERLTGSLADCAGPRRVPEEERARIREVVKWCLDAANGLGHAHSLGILHRDVKPGNLLLGTDGRVRVGDFGLARIDADESLTLTGQAVGTPRYASPEQCRGQKADVRSDVYGLGATLYYLLSGEAPPPALSDVTRALAFPGSVPGSLRAIARRAMAMSPTKRHRDMSALAADLDAWQRGRGQEARLLGVRPAVAVAVVTFLSAAGAVHLLTRDKPVSEGRPATAATARDPDLPGGFVLRWLEQASFETPAQTLLRIADLTWAELSMPAGVLDTWTFDSGGSTYCVGMETDPPSVTLRRGDDVTARFFPLDASIPSGGHAPGGWRLSAIPPRDFDGDGRLDVAITDGGGVALVKWDLAAWGNPADGWDVRVPGKFVQTSVAVEDWDGDGRLEAIVGDAGTVGRSGADRISSTLYEIDLATGGIDRTWPLDGFVSTTPQLLRDGRGRVAAMFVNTSGYQFDRGYLYRFDPAAPGAVTKLATEGDRPAQFSWPAFQDVDRDGTPEILFLRDRQAIVCMRSDLSGSPLWTHALDTAVWAEPLTSAQDPEDGDELCFGASGSFGCWRTAQGLAETDRLAWKARLPGGTFFNQAVSAGDLDGDGLPELASGNTDGTIHVFGATAPEHVLLSIGPPSVARGAIVVSDYYIARLAPRSDGDGSVMLVGATTGGWVHAWRLTAGKAEWEWSYPTHQSFIATPQWVRIAPPQGEPRWCVLVASADGYLRLLEPPAAPVREPRVAWSFATPSQCSGTPAVVQEGDQLWVVFAAMEGRVLRLPIRLRG